MVMGTSAGRHRSWAPGMKESAGKPKLGKNPNPPKSKQTLNLPEQQGENLNFLGKPSTICQGEKLEYCGIYVALNEGLTLVISFAFPKEIKIFSCLRGPLLWKQQRASTHGFLKIYTHSILTPIHSSLLPLLPAANPPKM